MISGLGSEVLSAKRRFLMEDCKTEEKEEVFLVRIIPEETGSLLELGGK